MLFNLPDAARPRLAVVGVAIVAIAAVIFVVGLVGVVMGSEVALLPMMAAFGLGTLGIGVLVASRR